MVSSNNQLGVTLTARDQITAVLKRVEDHTRRLDGAFGSLGARLKTGIQWHILNNGLNMLDRAFRRLVDTIPDLIHRGEQWASVVDDISDATGMSAAKASELAGVQKLLTGTADGLSTAFKALSKSVTEHTDDWKAYGVEIARTKDGNVDAYGTFQNLRQAISATGSGTLSFAAAQKLAGRGAAQLLDLLTLTNQQWKAYAEQARKSGLILTEAGAKAAEQWGRTRNLLDSAFTGIGSQILQGVAPTLIGLTNAVTTVIQKNMANIVRFVSGAIAFVAGMVSQFLGVDLDINLIAQLDGAGRSAERAAPRIRQQGQAAKQTASAQRDLAASTKALRDAERELAAARADMPFAGNMSDADYILARQARSARIAAAQERVDDAKKALAQHRKTMGDITDVNHAALQRMGGQWKRYSGAGGPVVDGLKQTLADAKGFGAQIADAIQDAIFGPDQQVQLGGGKPITVRSGGLVTALQNATKWMEDVATKVGNLAGLLGDDGPLIAALVGAGIVGKVTGGGAGGFFSNWGWQALGGAAGWLGQEILGQQDRRSGFSFDLFKNLNQVLGRDYTSDLNRADAKHKGQGTLEYLLDFQSTLKWWTDFLKPPAAINSADYFYNEITGQYELKKPGYTGWRTDGPDSPGRFGGYKLDWQLIQDNMPAGFGLANRTGIDALTAVERSLGVGGTATSLLERVESAIYTVTDAVNALELGGGGGGGTGLADRVATLESRVDTISRRNVEQDKRMDGIVNVNRTQSSQIIQRETKSDHNADVKAIKRVNTAQGNLLDTHEARLDKLDGGGSGPHAAPGRAAGAATVVNVFLDSRRIARAMAPSSRTTSLKPVS